MNRFDFRNLAARDWGFIAAMFALILDQGSKLLMLHAFGFNDMRSGDAVSVFPFFNLVMVWNPGVSYGLFPARGLMGTLLLALFSAGAVAALGWWMWHSHRKSLTIGLGLVIGGALGNLMDRVIYGAVADFFHFYAFGYDWYVFNVADVAITFGVIALLYDALVKPEARAERSS
ncbi:MAG TPA: signal peptidase II [Rhizomicrobium sp.]|jgi:signal peptidase II